MRRKIAYVVLLFILLSTGYSGIVYAEFTRIDKDIKNQMPEVLTSYDLLPKNIKDGYELRYFIDGDEVNGNSIFEKSLNDESHKIEVIVRRGLFEQSYVYNSKKDTKKLGITDNYFIDVFTTIDTKLSERIEGDTPLPYFENNEHEITYSSHCVEIKNGVLVYDFPTLSKTCTVTAHVTYNNERVSKSYKVKISSPALLDDLPKVYINTSGKEMHDKNDLLNARLTVKAKKTVPHSKLNNEKITIRLRGNSTSSMPKKSYKISFEEQTKFLNDYKDKDWVLLANYTDQTLIRNALAFNMANDISSNFQPSVQFVELYLNNEYLGLYLLTDQIEVTKDRVNIEEHTTNIDTGFLIEYDIGITRFPKLLAKTNHFVSGTRTFVIKTPNDEDEDLVQKQNEFINEYMDNLFEVLRAKEDYTTLIDEQSFIDWYIVNEVFKNCDVGFSSVYLYKDTGQKLFMGPVWDFDLSSGNAGHFGEKNGPTEFFTQTRNYIFDLLMRYDTFREHLKERWNELYDDHIITLLDDIYPMAASITIERNNNFAKWNIIGKNRKWYTADEVYQAKTYQDQVYYLYTYLDERIHWLDTEINKF